MFNFFNTKHEQPIDNETIASITYLIRKNENGALIDVSLGDYEDESIQALCSLLDILSNDSFYIDTISMIKNSLVEEGREDILATIFSKINSSFRNKIINSAKERIKNEPYIKPSEMFRQE